MSSKEDILATMTKTPPTLLQEIEEFLDETGMGASYFGKKSIGNSELVTRLRGGGRVWPDTEEKVRSFIMASRQLIRAEELKPHE